MSNAGHFNNKHAQEEKLSHVKQPRFFEDFNNKHAQYEKPSDVKQPRFFEDFAVAERRLPDNRKMHVKGGKIVWEESAKPVKESKHIAKADIATPESKFYKQTPITTLVERTTAGEKAGSSDTMGEKDTASRIRKRIDVNAPSMRL